MIDLDTLRKTKGYVLAIVNESTGEYKPISDDVVQVIRCKNCKHHHYDSHGIPYCDKRDYGYGWEDDDFCSKVERKENDTVD
mgnify:CR=1 FL=1